MKIKRSKGMKALLSMLLIAAMLVLTVMIAVNNPAASIAEAATKPTISKKTRNILIGKKYNLNINNKIAKSTYKWTSSDNKIATVDNKGIVTAKSKGVVDITCTITTPDKTIHKVTSKVTVREPALYFAIKNEVSALNLGQEYDLNRRLAPSSSNDKTTWTTSDASIANPDSLGRFTALKEGTVTITGTTMSGKSDSVTIKVIDKEGIVTNQEELDALVGSGAELITIKTDDEVEFDIKGGKYLGQTLKVDAPNADIKNSGVFKVIEIIDVKADTWYERAIGNLLKILDKDIGIVIASYASVSIEVNEENAVLRIENNGKIEEIVINKESELDITGDSKEDVPVVVNVPNIRIKTSVPLNLVSNARFELEVLPGGENTTITAANKDVVPTIIGNVNIKVVINDEEETVPGIPTPPTGDGGYIPGPRPTPIPDPKPGEYRLNKDLNQVASVKVEFVPFGLNYTVEADMLNTLIGFLNDTQATVNQWKATTDTTKTYGSVQVQVTGSADSLTKQLDFLTGDIMGRSFDVTVDPSDNSVTIVGASLTFKVKKLSERSILITPALSEDVLKFTFTYK
ncbi:MAG: hypothetical protein EWM47_09295 [Anaerolineaceae bacterium]|nr:MAG: hypothetical protein EWM47_09295 [Anaerolineaceae bacterium]